MKRYASLTVFFKSDGKPEYPHNPRGEGRTESFEVPSDFEIPAPKDGGWGFITSSGRQVAYNWSDIHKVEVVQVEVLNERKS